MDKQIEENEEIVEATSASETLKPGGAPGQTRAEMLSTFTSLMSQLGKEDFSKWFNDSIKQIGHENDSIPGGAAAKNKASVAMKEDLDEFFSEDETLSEEFKEKAATIFESIVSAKVNIEVSRLEEEFETAAADLEEQYNTKLEESSEAIFEEVTEKLNVYLDHVVESWLEENRIEVESSLRTELAEEFIDGLKGLFAEHYIEVPEERLDVLSDMEKRIDELTAKLDETLDENLVLQNAINEAVKESIIDDAADGLAETQVEKLKSLTEGVEFVDADTFAKKVSIIKESHFNKKAASPETGFITEEIDGSAEDKDEYVAPGMEQYVNAISKINK